MTPKGLICVCSGTNPSFADDDTYLDLATSPELDEISLNIWRARLVTFPS